MTDRPDWHQHAACHGHPDPALWFPHWSLYTSGKARNRYRVSEVDTAAHWSPEAVAICLTCPAQNPCLDYAARRNLDGIWAATTPPERAAIRRNRGLTLIEDPDPIRPATEDTDAA